MIDYYTFNDMKSENTKEREHLSHQYSKRIDNLICEHNDNIRTPLFNLLLKFYNHITHHEYLWESKEEKLIVDECVEYITSDRPAMINDIIEIELGMIHNLSLEEELAAQISQVEKYDTRYIKTIVDLRNLINQFV